MARLRRAGERLKSLSVSQPGLGPRGRDRLLGQPQFPPLPTQAPILTSLPEIGELSQKMDSEGVGKGAPPAVTSVTFARTWPISCFHSGSSKHDLTSRMDRVFWSSRQACGWAKVGGRSLGTLGAHGSGTPEGSGPAGHCRGQRARLPAALGSVATCSQAFVCRSGTPRPPGWTEVGPQVETTPAHYWLNAIFL